MAALARFKLEESTSENLEVKELIKVSRVKSGNFGHRVNSDIHLQTVEIQIRRLLMSCLIWIFTVCLVNLVFYSNNYIRKQTRLQSEFT